MQKIIGYCRVSTDNQKDEGVLREYAEAEGYDLVKVFFESDEEVSRRFEDRPITEMHNLLKDKEASKEVKEVWTFSLEPAGKDNYISQQGITSYPKYAVAHEVLFTNSGQGFYKIN